MPEEADTTPVTNIRERLDKPPPPPYVIEPSTTHTHTFILLHTLSYSGNSFGREFMARAVCSDQRGLATCFPGARFIFPSSRWRLYSVKPGYISALWFDHHADPDVRNCFMNLAGMRESFREILALIENEERNGIPRRNMVLGGLGHGGAMAVICAIALDGTIGGLLGFNAWAPAAVSHAAEHASGEPGVDVTILGREYLRQLLGWLSIPRGSTVSAPMMPPQVSGQNMPVFLGHGKHIEKPTIARGEDLRRAMTRLGFTVEWSAYEGRKHPHREPNVIDNLVRFVREKVWVEEQ